MYICTYTTCLLEIDLNLKQRQSCIYVFMCVGGETEASFYCMSSPKVEKCCP
jgi:hypothetical protein